MTTSRCSQLPEVLSDRLDSAHARRPGCRDHTPDCPGPAHPGKALDESGVRGGGVHPQYVMQVSAKDGQLLSTVVGTFATQSALVERPMCRICHEGSVQEELLSPCECAGTLGTIHRSCLEQWLSSSSTSSCELCHFQFSVQHKTPPLLEWVRSPGLRQEKRTLLGDMVCFLLITPLATISGWLCLRGAVDHLTFSSRLEAVGLIALTVALFTIYLFWTLVSLRYHCRLYNEWRLTNQRVVLLLPRSHGEPPPQQALVGPPPLKRHSKETIV
ncbi:E3 ubiquitin-protein ligase MARCHF3-like [Conger conger]|uniref:E3 ubiquitin-protein ligase MARCHF3-like n=1 Tax=Conger conger TaxID=82655 RepID=UPI002A5A73E8|nr:E3 ubiquitin-protein ligase MARCHF3-like [Conger conger]